MSFGSRFVGREDELARIEASARCALRGDPRCLVLAGEAGIGKTRLMDHIADRMRNDGVRVLRTACVELGTAGLPLAPVTAALRQLVRDLGADGVTGLVPAAEPLLGLLPELGRPDTGQDGQARLFDLFTTLLRRLGEREPVMLAIDDLQWADRSTRELIGMLARTLRDCRALIVMAYRSDDLDRRHPLRPFLAELERLDVVERVELSLLSRVETAELVAATLSHAPSDELVDRVYTRSHGNPLFAEELARAGSTSGLPDSLRDLLAHHIEQLPEPARRVVRLAAVGGPHVSHDLLAATAGMPEAELLAALHAAAVARVLLPDPDGYGFRHSLLREVALSDLIPAERVRLHRGYAQALEADPGLVPADRFAAEVAYHWYGARQPARALPALLRAATAAQRVNAHAEQAETLLRALEVWPEVPETERPAELTRGALWEQATVAATWAGEHVRAVGLVDSALAEVDRTAEPERVATLLALRGMSLHSLGRDGAVTSLREAEELLPAEPSPARARVLDLLGVVLLLRGLPEEAREVCDEAIRIARSLDDPETETNVGITMGVTLCQLSGYPQGLSLLEQARDLAERRGDLIRLTRAYVNLAEIRCQLGRYQAAAADARSGLDHAGAAGVSRTLGGLLRLYLARSLAALGQWDEADAAAVAALDLDPPPRPGALLHVLRGELSLARGDLTAARRHHGRAQALLDQVTDAGQESLAVWRLEAELAGRDNRPDAARTALTRILPDGRDRQVWPLLATTARLRARIRPAERAHGGGSQPDVIEMIRATAARLPEDTPPAQAYAAQVAAELGDRPWPDVVAAWDRVGEPYPAAYARLRAAEAALAHGDRGAAREWLHAAGEQADRLGAAPLRAEIDALTRGARIETGNGAAPSPGSDPADRLGLTERELEVLRLVTTGLSNRGIGDRLYISTKTVSVHVSNILAKLGVSSRGEAAATAHRLGLFRED